MAVIIFGGSGMLGQELVAAYRARGDGVIAPTHAEVNISELGTLRHFVRSRRGIDLVVNAAGAIPQRGAEFLQYARTNALGAGYVARTCAEESIPLIHVSTDCVFSGKRTDGPYLERDKTDADSPYGRSKAIGESAVLVSGAQATVVRCSFIGPEHGFWRWLTDAGEAGEPVELWRKAAWSGSTAREIARCLAMIHPAEAGRICHLTDGEAISKAAVAEALWISGLAKRTEYRDVDLPITNRWIASEHGNRYGVRPLIEALEEYA